MPALAATGTGEGGGCHLRVDHAASGNWNVGADWTNLPVTGGFSKNGRRGGDL